MPLERLTRPDWIAWPEQIGLLDRMLRQAPQTGMLRPRILPAVAHEVQSGRLAATNLSSR